MTLQLNFGPGLLQFSASSIFICRCLFSFVYLKYVLGSSLTSSTYLFLGFSTGLRPSMSLVSSFSGILCSPILAVCPAQSTSNTFFILFVLDRRLEQQLPSFFDPMITFRGYVQLCKCLHVKRVIDLITVQERRKKKKQIEKECVVFRSTFGVVLLKKLFNQYFRLTKSENKSYEVSQKRKKNIVLKTYCINKSVGTDKKKLAG